MTMTAAQGSRASASPDDAGAARRRRWRGRPRPEAAPAGDWPETIGRVLALRGITDAESAAAFVAPPGDRPDPYALPALDIAIDRLLRAVRAGETVAIFGDFDVDGVTSAAQLSQAIAALGGVPMPYVPDRFSEGYGLNIPAIERLRSAGATLLVTADCGTSSIEEVARAREIGMDVIVLDHHTVPPQLPDALALVNPKLPDARPGGMLELATAGLAFHVAAALHAAADRPFDEAAYIDIAALGTVCDMAPLLDENRRLIRGGLPALAETRRPGLRALMAVANMRAGVVTAEDIGYKLGPRLNAAGRIAHAKLALELLMTADEERGSALALELDALNRTRQQKTAEAVALAQQMIGDADPPPLIMIGHEDFSSGIVGLIASKLVNVYARPAVVFERGAELSRASCRSIDDFHITDALRERPDLFLRFGGHRAAAGFTCETARAGEVEAHLVAAAGRELAGRELAPILEIDAQLPLRQLRADEIRWLGRLGPYGIGNPQPMFLARGVSVGDVRWIGQGEKHRRMKLRDGMATWTAVAFDMADLVINPGDVVDVVYTVELGAGLDGNAELRVEDMRPTERPPA